VTTRHQLAHAFTTGILENGSTAEVWALARTEGLLPLMARALAGRTAVPAAIAREAADLEARAALDDRDLRTVLDEFARRRIRVLVFKGAALAHQLYARPGLRPRADSDLLIARGDVDRVHALFGSLHARHVAHVTGEYVMAQFHYVHADAAGCDHTYDVHWRVVNPTPFAHLFDFDDLWGRAVPLPPLAASGRTPSFPDALLMACVHRAAHHGASGPLVWLLDIDRLAGRLDPAGRELFVDRARAGRISGVAAHALLESAEFFGGPATAALAAELANRAGSLDEPTARYLTGRTRLRETLSDLSGLPWSARARLVRELVVPPAAYMREVYGARHRGPLPFLYLRRAVTGAWRWGRR
jgi:hypothetical protein